MKALSSFIPKPVRGETRWECILVDKSNANRTAIMVIPNEGPAIEIKWRVCFIFLMCCSKITLN